MMLSCMIIQELQALHIYLNNIQINCSRYNVNKVVCVCVHECVHACVHACVRACMHECVCLHACVCACMRACVHVYIFTYKESSCTKESNYSSSSDEEARKSSINSLVNSVRFALPFLSE